MTWTKEAFANILAVCNNIFEQRGGEIKTFADFYHIVEVDKHLRDATNKPFPTAGGDGSVDIYNMANRVSYLANAHIDSIDDLRECMKVLSVELERKHFVHGIDESDVAQMLYEHSPGKYAYTDRDRFFNMQVVTDSDFIDYKGLSNEDYELIYGILYNVNNGASVYDCIANSFNETIQPINRKCKLLHWHNVFQKVIDGIEACKDKANAKELSVYVPFLDFYHQTASETIELFRMAQDVVTLLRETPCDAVLEMETPDDFMRVKSMKKMMLDFAESEDTDLGGIDVFARDATYNEMARRGLLTNFAIHPLVHEYDSYILGKVPSSVRSSNGMHDNEKQTSLIRKIAVMHYMLKGKGLDVPTMHRLAHFLIQDYQDFKGTDNGKASIYNYLKRAERGESLATTPDAVDYVKEKLLKYGFKDEAKEV